MECAAAVHEDCELVVDLAACQEYVEASCVVTPVHRDQEHLAVDLVAELCDIVSVVKSRVQPTTYLVAMIGNSP